MKPLYISLKPFLNHGVLPRPVNWFNIFNNDQPLEVEIGFGNGEYLAKLCREHPNTNFVGFEEYCERISRTLRKLSREQASNVRVLRLDVRPAFNYLFAPRSIAYIHCLFPPPWPKKSDIKHRLFSTEFLRLANSRLKDNGIMKIVTDHKPYAEWINEQIPGSGFTITRTVIPASYGTKFEQKWVGEGQREFDEIILTKKEHADILHKEDSTVQHYTISNFDPDRFKMGEYIDGNIAVVFQEILYDPKRQTAMVHVLVHDEQLLQNVRAVIVKVSAGWSIHLAQGSMLMPTAGIAKALECVRDAAENSTR